MKLIYVLPFGFWCFQAIALHSTMLDPLGKIREIYYVNQDGYAVVEDDIILTKIKNLPNLHASIIPNVGGTRWPEGKVPFKIASNLPKTSLIAFKEAIALWQEKTHIQFIEITSDDIDQYPDYLLIQPAEETICESEVGKKYGEQPVRLSTHCNTMSIVHELGHALGLWHEQSRHDKDQYIQVVWENIKDGHAFNFTQHLTDGEDYGPYNYDSIMHYSAYAFSKNGEKTMIPLQENISIGQRNHLSQGDIDAVNGMYP